MLTACILLGIMILPTIIGTTESALRSVTRTYYEGALALGATKERTIFTVMLPAAKSGVLTGVVLGIGRAIGETMAVIMIAGNQTAMPTSLLKGVRTLTANIVLEMGYATGPAQRGADCYSRRALCIYSDYQLKRITVKEGRKCRRLTDRL